MKSRARRISRRRRIHSSEKRPFFDKGGEAAFFSQAAPVSAFVQKRSFSAAMKEPGTLASMPLYRQPEASQNNIIRRRPDKTTQFRPLELPFSLVDSIVSHAIISELQRFQRIPIAVANWHTTQIGGVAVPYPKIYFVHVKAAYFINAATARAHFGEKDRRGHRDFRRVMKALKKQGQKSDMPNYKGKPRSVARTVKVGKGTPDDLRTFIQTAVSSGAVRNFARRKKKLAKGQKLTDLSQADAQQVIQEWVYHHGIGIDCSGFVLQAALRAREKVRETAEGVNKWMGGTLFRIPPAIKPTERGAASFKSRRHRGAKVTKPTGLHPGDAWVVGGGAHIRIVTDVRTVKRKDGSDTIEFDTAESTGGSRKVTVGPAEKTWRTASKERFGTIVLVKGPKGGSAKGPFYRIP
jgi:hypothetical protein